jgi:signal transduction histidine kinase/ligand-binding sensor domain-containing protein/DNA-binding response OmpR family regulator
MRRVSALLLLFFSFFSPVQLPAQSSYNEYNPKSPERFKQISLSEGLSQSTVYSIMQDSKGFIWAGTRAGGLNIYNGYEFKVYNTRSGDSSSISDNEITCILEDSHHVIWIGTRNGGLNRFDRNSESFIRYPFSSDDNKTTFSQSINILFEDKIGVLWVGTRKEFLRYDREKDVFIPVKSSGADNIENVSGILEDAQSNLILGTREKLIKFFRNNNSTVSYKFDSILVKSASNDKKVPVCFNKEWNVFVGSPEGLLLLKPDENGFARLEIGNNYPIALSNDVRTIFNEDNKSYWFGTYDGLIRYDIAQNKYQVYSHDENNPLSLAHNSVYSFYRDKAGNFWIGTWNGGISFLAKNQIRFEHFRHQINNPYSLSNNVVSAFAEDKGGVWIGTEAGGLNFLDTLTWKITVFKNWRQVSDPLSSSNVKAVFVDAKGDLWVGTFGSGLKKYNRISGKFEDFLRDKKVFTILQDSMRNLWVGCQDGLYKVSEKGIVLNRYINDPANPKSLGNDHIMSALIDSRKRIWFGTKGAGINLYNPQTDNFTRIPVDSLTPVYSSEYVNSLCEDSKGRIWSGSNTGLSLYNEKHQVMVRILDKGLPADVVNSVIDDRSGHLWLSTNQGLTRWTSDKGEVRYYNVRDGLQSNEFNRGSCFRHSCGKLYFGGINGFNVFSPDEIIDNQIVPPVIITDLRLFNKIVKPFAEDSPLKVNIDESKSITLTHFQSFFGFDFVALNYIMPEKNQYEFMLEGYDKTWNNSGTGRRASYMNLKPGNYIFKVRASNNDLIWNMEGTSIAVTILPPYWKTIWAYLVYLVLIMGFLFVLRKLIIIRIEQANLLHNERLEKKRLEEINQMKLVFFTDISHEFRTPLTLISGPLEKLKHQELSTQEVNYLYGVMSRNVSRLLRLVNQLMDFRKAENEKLKLKVCIGNLPVFIGEIIDSFRDSAASKKISLTYEIKTVSTEQQWFDHGIVDKVVFNLLANAFKFTANGGSIQVSLKVEGGKAEICVEDNGIGIAKENIGRIFDRFFMVEEAARSHNTGTGIGLALTKKLVDLHLGEISVSSNVGEGSSFTFIFSILDEVYSESEIVTEEKVLIKTAPAIHETYNESETTLIPEGGKEEKQIMLIVEDNDDLRNFLKVSFRSFIILEAANGRDGLNQALGKLPDIVISDIMMPEMNGYELCNEIKSNYITCHIPVVLLTAKTSIEHKIKGYETGADAYVEKPFDFNFLEVQVKNLLIQRSRLKNKYSSFSPFVEISDVESEDPNQKFLKKVFDIIKENASDSDLSVDSLGKMMGMSRAQLFRKFRAIMDKSPSDYIREVRLKLAYSLLSNKNYNINEVAFKSGFSSTSYFITCFRKYYGKTPGEVVDSL